MKVTFTGSRPAPQPRLVPKPESIDHTPLTDEEIIEMASWVEEGMNRATQADCERMELIFAKVRALEIFRKEMPHRIALAETLCDTPQECLAWAKKQRKAAKKYGCLGGWDLVIEHFKGKIK